MTTDDYRVATLAHERGHLILHCADPICGRPDDHRTGQFSASHYGNVCSTLKLESITRWT